jgi:dTDP-4-amino-4,6-dideoxygalactose transaminase
LGALRFPISEAIAAQCLSLPMFAEMTEGQIAQVAAVMREALHGTSAPPELAVVTAH